MRKTTVLRLPRQECDRAGSSFFCSIPTSFPGSAFEGYGILTDAKTPIPTEERLLRETASLGRLLNWLPDPVSPVLVGAREWKSLLQRADGLPAALAAFPFGFELRLHDAEPRADLGVMVAGGSRSADFFGEAGRSDGADVSTRAVPWLLRETEQEGPLHRIAEKAVVLEYDIDPEQGAHPPPGLFLSPAGRGGADSSGESLQVPIAIASALATATGRCLGAAVPGHLERVCLAMPPEAAVASVGVFPARGNGVRLAVRGFRHARSVTAFLERVGWPNDPTAARDVLLRFEGNGAFAYVSVQFEIDVDGVKPRLGLSLFAREQRRWAPDILAWRPLLRCVRDLGIANAESLSALADSSSGTGILFGSSGAFLLQRGIHHIKLVQKEDRFEEVKAYYLFLLAPS